MSSEEKIVDEAQSNVRVLLSRGVFIDIDVVGSGYLQGVTQEEAVVLVRKLSQAIEFVKSNQGPDYDAAPFHVEGEQNAHKEG